jgi:hypothetical protein
MICALWRRVFATGFKARSTSSDQWKDAGSKRGKHMARKTLILAALIALGLGSAFVISTVSSVSVLAETTNGGSP